MNVREGGVFAKFVFRNSRENCFRDVENQHRP